MKTFIYNLNGIVIVVANVGKSQAVRQIQHQLEHVMGRTERVADAETYTTEISTQNPCIIFAGFDA